MLGGLKKNNLHGYLYKWNRYKFIKENTIDERENKYTLQGMIMIK